MGKAAGNFKKQEYKEKCMQDKMMPGTAQYVFYYQVICRDFNQSNILSALLLYAQRFLSGFKKNIPSSSSSQPLPLALLASAHCRISHQG